MSKERARLFLAYEEHGEDYVLRDPELRALLAADPELQATFAYLQQVDVELGRAPRIAMPREVEEAIRARAERPLLWQRLAQWMPVVDAPLSFATLLLVILSPLTLWALVERGGGEARVLELVPSTVSFDMSRARELDASKGESDAGELIASEAAPVTIIVPRAKRADAIEAARTALTLGKRDGLRVQGLVNAFDYGADRSRTRVELELAEAPWRRETVLLRVYMVAAEPLSDVRVELAFDPQRVKRYRRLADFGPQGAMSAAMARGDDFTALYELVVAPSIGAPNAEPLAVATLRASGGLSSRAEARITKTPASPDFRFASAVAYFALQARGELGESRDAYDRIAALAGRAIDRGTQKDRGELLALIALAARR